MRPTISAALLVDDATIKRIGRAGYSSANAGTPARQASANPAQTPSRPARRISETGDKAEYAALADAAPHQLEIDDLMIVDVEVDRIAERIEIPDLGGAVLGLENEILHVELRHQVKQKLLLHRFDAFADTLALYQHFPGAGFLVGAHLLENIRLAAIKALPGIESNEEKFRMFMESSQPSIFEIVLEDLLILKG